MKLRLSLWWEFRLWSSELWYHGYQCCRWTCHLHFCSDHESGRSIQNISNQLLGSTVSSLRKWQSRVLGTYFCCVMWGRCSSNPQKIHYHSTNLWMRKDWEPCCREMYAGREIYTDNSLLATCKDWCQLVHSLVETSCSWSAELQVIVRNETLNSIIIIYYACLNINSHF